MLTDSTKRFSDRVENYIKYRPGYPPALLVDLKANCNLATDSIIADIGAGTGIFTKLLLDEGYHVYTVEPNKPMRDAAIEDLLWYDKFAPVNGTAEATTLKGKSIDLIVCAQAFHWFNNNSTRTEFRRILTDNGKAALIWNNRLTDVDEFSIAYDKLLKNDSVDYNKVNHQNINDIDFKAFFKDGLYTLSKYPNVQVFDEEGLIGRALSSSYMPQRDTSGGKKFLKMLKAVFEQHNIDGKVFFQYQTEVYLGEV